MAKLARPTDSVAVAVAPEAATVVVWFLGLSPVVRRSVAVSAAPVVLLELSTGMEGGGVTIIETRFDVMLLGGGVRACTLSVPGVVPALYVTVNCPLASVTPLVGDNVPPDAFCVKRKVR